MIKYSVYIKLNSLNEITYINSSLYDSGDGLIKIDSGFGNKYAHAQQNYLTKEIVNNDGTYNYKYINGNIQLITELKPPIIQETKSQHDFNIEIMLELSKIKSKLGVE